MSAPAYGDTRVAPCSWCGAPDVEQTFQRYPPSAGLPGGFWDTGACRCSTLRGIIALGTTVLANQRERAGAPQMYRDGVLRRPPPRGGGS